MAYHIFAFICCCFISITATVAQRNLDAYLQYTSLSPKPSQSPQTPRNLKPAPAPTQKPGSKTNPSPPPKPSQNATISPYHFVDHFCLSRRIHVKPTFCLYALRSSPGILNVKDNKGLLFIAADAAIKHGNTTLDLLQRMSRDKIKNANTEAVIRECQPAYEGFVKQYKMLLEEAKTEAQMAGFDAELAVLEIQHCVKACHTVFFFQVSCNIWDAKHE